CQLVICGISFPFLIVIFRIRGTFVPPYRFAYTLKQPHPKGSLSPLNPFGPHACKSLWSLACCAPKAPVCALSLCPVPINASHSYALKCAGLLPYKCLLPYSFLLKTSVCCWPCTCHPWHLLQSTVAACKLNNNF